MTALKDLTARALTAPIRIYQRFISPMLGERCRFYPSCSEYTARAILKFGPIRGMYLGARRLLRCHPWNPGGVDHIPDEFAWRRAALRSDRHVHEKTA